MSRETKIRPTEHQSSTTWWMDAFTIVVNYYVTHIKKHKSSKCHSRLKERGTIARTLLLSFDPARTHIWEIVARACRGICIKFTFHFLEKMPWLYLCYWLINVLVTQDFACHQDTRAKQGAWLAGHTAHHENNFQRFQANLMHNEINFAKIYSLQLAIWTMYKTLEKRLSSWVLTKNVLFLT